MFIKTLWLPGFTHRLYGRRTRTAGASLSAAAQELGGLAALAGRFFNTAVLPRTPGARDRVFSLPVIFWAFLAQVLTRGSSCREAVRRVQAWRTARGLSVPDGGTSAYCQGRARLPLAWLEQAHGQVEQWIAARGATTGLWQGHHVRVLDGCGLSMPDSAANRQRWPYASGQKAGCGFPTAQLVGLFCLGTGRLIRFVVASWKAHELPLARQLAGWIQPGEVVLADRAFCGWGFLALLHQKGVAVVMRVHQARTLRGRTMRWPKPQRPHPWAREIWATLPVELPVRLVRFRTHRPGFRTDHIVLVTTLLDTVRYPDAALAALYFRRWQVELNFRDIKTTLGLDVVRCQTPALVEKEIWMQVLAYNLVRALMLEAAQTYAVPVERLSFKGTVDTVRQWAPLCAATAARQHRTELLQQIAADKVPLRPGRSEPRARKRRPKSYQLLTRPRHQMVVSASRGNK